MKTIHLIRELVFYGFFRNYPRLKKLCVQDGSEEALFVLSKISMSIWEQFRLVDPCRHPWEYFYKGFSYMMDGPVGREKGLRLLNVAKTMEFAPAFTLLGEYANNVTLLEKAIQMGDATACYCLANLRYDENIYKLGAQRGSTQCLQVMQQRGSAFHYQLDTYFWYQESTFIVNKVDFEQSIQRCVDRDTMFDGGRRCYGFNYIPLFDPWVEWYNKVTKCARSTSLAFIFYNKPFFGRDIARIIGQIIYRQRGIDSEEKWSLSN